MPIIHFTARLKALVPEGPLAIAGESVGEALERVFAEHRQARGYVLDEQGQLRKHVCIFLDGERLVHERALQAALTGNSEIYVMQALSGG